MPEGRKDVQSSLQDAYWLASQYCYAGDRMRSETPATPCSALTQLVNAIERKKVNVHATFQAKVSGQLPNLGLNLRNNAWSSGLR